MLHVYNLWIYDFELVRLVSIHVGQQKDLTNMDNLKNVIYCCEQTFPRGKKCTNPLQTNSNEMLFPLPFLFAFKLPTFLFY